MNYQKDYRLSTAELTIIGLCNQIDELKEEIDYWKSKFEEERNENNRMINENLSAANQGVRNALMFALCVSDNENGDLVISNENRKVLAENIKLTKDANTI